MSSPPIVPNTGSNYVIPIAFASGQATIKQQDSLSLFSFLQFVDTTKNVNKQTVFDGQEVDSLVNKEYFLGVAHDISFLSQKYIKVVSYADTIKNLNTSYNTRVTSLNTAIDTYNNAKNVLNGKISDMNNAINTINSISSPTPSDIANYNAAVTVYNSYLTTIGNPALLSYATSANNIYNIPTNNDNTVTIPALNQLIDDLNLGIPHYPLFSPATAPAGASTRPPQANYAGGTIPLISPSSYNDLSHLNGVPGPQSKTDIIDTYFTPFATAYLAAIAATSRKLSGIDDYRGFVNFLLKQGFKLNPAIVNAYILNTAKPSLPGITSSNGAGSPGNLIVGVDSPKLEIILSTALFKYIAAQASVSLPPHLYDQLNVLAVSLLAQVGAAAGLAVVKLLGETLKSLSADSASINVATAAALLQNILKVVGDSKTKETLLNLLKAIPGLSEAQAKQLADQLLASQNLSLLLFGALGAGVALKSPTLVQDVLNTTFSNQNVSTSSTTSTTETTSSTETDDTTASDSSNEIESDPYNPTGANAVLNNPQSSYEIQDSLSDRLAADAQIPKPQASSIVGSALQNTAATTPPNASSDLIQQTLQNELLRQNLREEEAQFLAENANQLIKTYTNPIVLSSADLAKKLGDTIQDAIKGDISNPLPKSVTEVLIKSLTDTKDPNSFASLIVAQVATLEKRNDIKINEQLTAQRREFERPNIDVFLTYKRIMDPANTIILSFMTGVMYDKAIPSNWQRPLSIQI